MARHFIVTGAPGAGKTTLIRYLERQGQAVVAEAATDVIAQQQACGVAEPWHEAAFITGIARLQLRRQVDAQQQPAACCFHDRSLFCTYALAEHLGHPVPPLLEQGIAEAQAQGVFERRVLLVRLLGFITPTAARRIGLEEATAFERVHTAVYRRFGFEIVPIEPGTAAERAAAATAITGSAA